MSGHLPAKLRVDWHRGLGIACGAWFILWFASGIVMIYARMPDLPDPERLARLPAIRATSIRALPTQPESGEITRYTLSSLEGRPMVRLTAGGATQFWFADTGDRVPAVDADQAIRIARTFEGGVNALRYDSRLIDADQWSFAVRNRVPLHRIAVDDVAGTVLYVAEDGGDVVLRTTASGRFWGAGAVVHWLYFTPLRRHPGLWAQSIIWLSIAGTLLCVIGIARGLWRVSPRRGHQLPDGGPSTPFAGSMRGRDYAALICGLATTTWLFSGLLSMNPWHWHPETTPTSEQRARVAGGRILAGEVTVPALRRVLQGFAPHLPKEVDVFRFRGRYVAVAAPGVVAFDAPNMGVRDQLPLDRIVGAANLAMAGVPIEGVSWLDDYDAYYYDRDRRLTLPVLRVRYADPQRTWLYFDPRRGTIARKEERLTRINRWLYHGLHSLDFPFLYRRRPLWDVVVILLCVGGLVLGATTIRRSWRRV